MAVDKREAKRTLEELLMTMRAHRSAEAEYRKKGDASAVARSKRVLKYDYSRIRELCAEHDLELPRDVPPAVKG